MKTIIFYRRNLDGSATKIRTIDAAKENVLPAKGDSVIFAGRKYIVNNIELNYDEEETTVILL